MFSAQHVQTSAERSKTGFLIKHLPAGTATDELSELFGKYGTIGRLLLPPQGLTAIIEYVDATEARAAFRALAYTKVTHSSYCKYCISITVCCCIVKRLTLL